MRWNDPKLWLAAVSIAAVAIAVFVERKRTSPGPLTSVHARDPQLADSVGCEACHGSRASSMATACTACHVEIGEQLAGRTGFHGSRKDLDVAGCGRCHSEHHGDEVALVDARVFALAQVADLERFEHDFVDFGLRGRHASLACARCHPNSDAKTLAQGEKRFLGLDQDCTSCHTDPHGGRFVAGCEACHGQEHPFAELANFVHTDELPLEGRHAGIECAKCHEPGSGRSVEALGGRGSKPTPRACEDCHDSPHTPGFTAGVAAQLGIAPRASCARCHPPSGASFAVEPPAMEPALHAASGFAFAPPHDQIACARCHDPDSPARYRQRRPEDCAACHASPHGAQFDSAGGAAARCTDCHAATHFEPATFDAAAHARAFALDGAHAQVACNQCHEQRASGPRVYRGTPSRCEQCHEDVHGPRFDAAMVALPAVQAKAGTCAACHTTRSFSEVAGFGAAEHAATTGFVLRGAHARTSCESCHARTAERDAQHRSFGRAVRAQGSSEVECSTCHRDAHDSAFDGVGLAETVDGRAGCARCHGEESFEELVEPFDHGRWTRFSLDGAHAGVACGQCHGSMPEDQRAFRKLGRIADRFRGSPQLCATCHADAHSGAFDRAGMPQRVGEAEGCARCHTTASFAGSARELFEHARFTSFALDGQHARAACEACHLPQAPDAHGRRFGRASGQRCADCHADPHAGQFSDANGTSCERCHESARSFGELVFDHQRDSRFALDERHSKLACSACHVPWPLPDGTRVVRYEPLGTSCADCHGFARKGGK